MVRTSVFDRMAMNGTVTVRAFRLLVSCQALDYHSHVPKLTKAVAPSVAISRNAAMLASRLRSCRAQERRQKNSPERLNWAAYLLAPTRLS